MMTDIEIAQQCRMHPIADIAATAGIDESYLEQYGRYKAKIDPQLLKDRAERPDGKLILVTAINPTPAGEGKTTTSVGLADGLRKIGKNAVAALREPSLGPVFGVKGGAAGGGYAQVVPMEDINLHFTGDFHAIGAANNLLAAMLDNHIQQGNALGIDVKQITWKRCVDMNDRQLRQIVDGLGGRIQGVPREDGFDITVASEVMAVLCLASDITDLKARLGRMIVAYTFDGKPVTAHDLKAEGAMTALLKDALKPNLVQTLEGTPTLIHGGPFANIAHGCNSVTATRMALKLGDYVVTEAGFGADLGAEKFLDIKCRLAGLRPNAVVIVATVRALKSHGGVPKAELNTENLDALEKGLPNLLHHVNTIRSTYHLPCVVAINAFPTDTEAELRLVEEKCRELGVRAVLSEVWAKGGEGGKALAEEVVRLCEQPSAEAFTFSYPTDTTLVNKLNARLGRMIVAYTFDGKPVTAHDLKAEGAMTALLKDALKPNLVQTLEGTPTLIHGGPFANIAHGCNSVTATRMALKLGDYVVTEAGFGADLGAEKFLDIKCRLAGLRPNAVVIVATVRALKSHGGVPKAELNTENLDALEKGLPNLLHHVNTIRSTYHLPCVVAINAFPTDTEAELRLVEEKCRELGVRAVLSEVWAKGGEGGKALAEEVVRLCEQPSAEAFTFSYPTDTTLVNKLNAIVQRVYGGAQAVLTPAAQKQAERLTELGFGDLPVCMAKTQYSLSDDPTLLGAPKDFAVTVRSLKVSAGAGFIVALTGEIMTMPGLPKVPAAEKIDVDENGRITGLF